MIFGKLWNAFKAQVNKLANVFHTADPIAQMQYEYDKSVEQLKEGRLGLEQYRALVERVLRQTESNKAHVANLEAKIQTYLQAGDRETAAKFALELQKAKKELAENDEQLRMHEEAYNNHILKVKHASAKLGEIKNKIQRYDAELKMSRAEAEMAKIAQDFHFDVTTDIGQFESQIQDKIGLNKAKARVAADLSGEGIEDIQREKQQEKLLADQALRDFEAQMGAVTPETAPATTVTRKVIGPVPNIE